MIDAGKLTAAAVPCEFHPTWRMAPLTDKLWEEMHAWVRSKHVQLAIEAAKEYSPVIFDRVVGLALNQSHSYRSDSEPGIDISNTLEGTIHIIWLSLKREQPTITEQQVLAALGSDEELKKNANLAMSVFLKLNKVESKNSEPPAGEPPTGNEQSGQ